jgi:hypothetical protein
MGGTSWIPVRFRSAPVKEADIPWVAFESQNRIEVSTGVYAYGAIIGGTDREGDESKVVDPNRWTPLSGNACADIPTYYGTSQSDGDKTNWISAGSGAGTNYNYINDTYPGPT